jgi:hypothetical protein
MAVTTRRYYLDNEPLTPKNIVNYLFHLQYYNIIPHFTVNYTDTEMSIIIIYSAQSTNLPLYGHTIITYNIYTKKWHSSINLSSIIDGKLVINVFNNINNNYSYLINNNLLKIKYQSPYVEYVLESHHIEDILEASLNEFNHATIDPRNITNYQNLVSHLLYTQRYIVNNEIAINNFNNKIDQHEKYLLFQLVKNIINEKYFLPEELWNKIYSLYKKN